jgi:hypothetical protein
MYTNLLRGRLLKQEVLQILQSGLKDVQFKKSYSDEWHNELLVRLKTFNWKVDENRIGKEIDVQLNGRYNQYIAELQNLRTNSVSFRISDIFSIGLCFVLRKMLYTSKLAFAINHIEKYYPESEVRRQIALEMFEDQKKYIEKCLYNEKIYISDYVERQQNRDRIISAISKLALLKFQNIVFPDSSLKTILFTIETSRNIATV